MESTAVDDVEFALESRLMSDGIYVDEVNVPPDGATAEEATYELRYESIATAENGVIPHREVGTVINMFRELHEDDWQGADIDSVVTDLDGNVLGRWHVEQAWLAALADGELSEVDFSAKVIDSIEPARS
jgi:hypothetical protein